MGKRTVTAALYLVASSAFAQVGGYVGFGAGQSSVDLEAQSVQSALASAGVTSQISTRERDTAMKVFGGYEFNSFIAMELGYARLGKAKADVTVTSPVSLRTQLTFEGRAYYLDAIGSLPITNALSAYARVGPALTTAIAKSVLGKSEEEEFNLKVGVGARYKFTNGADLRLDWERYHAVGDPDITGEADVDMVSLSLGARF